VRQAAAEVGSRASEVGVRAAGEAGTGAIGPSKALGASSGAAAAPREAAHAKTTAGSAGAGKAVRRAKTGRGPTHGPSGDHALTSMGVARAAESRPSLSPSRAHAASPQGALGVSPHGAAAAAAASSGSAAALLSAAAARSTLGSDARSSGWRSLVEGGAERSTLASDARTPGWRSLVEGGAREEGVQGAGELRGEALPALDMGVSSVAAIEPLIRMNVAEASLVERLERRLVAYEHGLDVENYEVDRAKWLSAPTDEERRDLPLAERLERRLEAYQMGLSPD
jgi:hypothetical protein